MMDRDDLRASVTLSRSSFRLEVSLVVPHDETVALVGPNGAGKSTFLSLVMGLLRPDRGRITMGDEIWCDTDRAIDCPPQDRRVGFVHQDHALFPHLTVAGNVAYGPRARGEGHGGSLDVAREWLDRLGLSGLGERRVAELSGGERQRVALARALASGARVLLLDEPLGSLDASTRAAVRSELLGFLEEVRLPTLIVTHDPVDALGLARRIAVIEAGRLSQEGTRDELLSRPGTPFVAELLGLNFYRAELSDGGELRNARVGSIVFHVLAPGGEGSVSLAFPPSAVVLSPEPPTGSTQNLFQGSVREILPLPDRIRVVIDCGVLLAADLTREAVARLDVAPGRRLWASVKATAIEVYR